ncbi:sigma-54-dependent Fis family transcriptional regulator [Candidatus Poribacteria bacterium]|nr:sigma-54-dependent Fis family transcriptional regulator [Candidatus Poribacteria bacterium]MYG07168.1 sigma-54-dependent Fis family transcriptional regulator [Candidatus Poribacteria bacterium]MYK22107.1 sigma-54-dependent Fis family transcriptional regulator [Candidatus Poribacteria bacterium]
MSNLVLIADDDDSLRHILAVTLEKAGYETLKARNGAETLACVKETNVDVILLDIWLGDANGLELIEDIQQYNSTASIIIITAHGTTQTAIDAAKQRAYGYLTKPIDQKQLLDLVSRAAAATHQTKTVKTSTSPDFDRHGKMVGQSPAMQEVYHKIGRAAVSDETVLVLGESGTGKELVAQLIHQNSRRVHNPFVVVDCGAMPSSLIESALFGHVKGAYTDAHSARKGKFQQADSGTIFLDEIGELPIEVQMKLLRVLQEREVEPMGGTETHAVDVRIIAATNRRLEAAIAQKSFREDLYYRLNVIPISLPPLRERKEDIPELVDLFTRQFVEEYQLPEIGISTEVVKQLTTYDWPGNVRELENAIKRALVMCSGQMLLPEHFDPILEKSTPISEPGDLNTQVHAMLQAHIEQYMESDVPLGELYAEIREVFEKPLFKIVLEHTNGNRSKASDILGINRNTLHTKLVEYQLVS